MTYLASIYTLIAAINAVLLLLVHRPFLDNIVAAFFVIAGSILGLAVGDDLRSLLKRGPVVAKMFRALILVVMFFVALWLGRHFGINLYFAGVSGMIWVIVGCVIGFFTNQGYLVRVRKVR